MNQNKFKIIVPSYNNEAWVEYNLASILNQTYTNYDVLYIDDCSQDNTHSLVSDIVGELPNWSLIKNHSNMRRGYNTSPYNENIVNFINDDDNILVFIDGDDWLYDENVLEKLNNFYNSKDVWMTYGKFVCYPNNNEGNPQNTEYPDNIHKDNLYRKDVWRASHLRTFKWWLYKKIKFENLIYSKTNSMYFHAEDLATSFACLEMCPKEKIGVLDFYSYVFNESETNRSRGVEREKEAGYDLENEIRNTIPYKKLTDDVGYRITNILSGGLGNMMFQISAAYSLSKKHGGKFLLNETHVGTSHNSLQMYSDNVFRNIQCLNEPCEFSKISEKSFSYNPIQFITKNSILDGYFQSYKYFESYEDEISKLFSPTEEILTYIQSKYGDLSNIVSIHVRRGNYINLSKYHHNLSIEYYLNAVDYFRGYKFLVFSDDIEWCKTQFKGNEFSFVENESDVVSLYLMSKCEHNIIANSTFSWWGAWLNPNPKKIVIYPDKWFGPNNSELKTWDLFPNDWICLSEKEPKIKLNLFDDSFGHLAKENGRYSSVHGKISSEVKFIKNQIQYDGITIFTDQHLNVNYNYAKSKYKIGWLIETREVNPSKYNSFPEYMNNFDFIMTHDQELLNEYPNNTKFTIFGGTWINSKNYGIHQKTKNISMIYSDKQYLTGHKLRHRIAQTVSDIDFYGKGTQVPLIHKEDALINYRYSVAVENSKTQNYFTEKLIDCFMVGTIPIYWGCPNIGNFFDVDGMIIVNTLEEIQNIVGSLDKKYYIDRIDNIKRNYELAKQYSVTEDWMYKNIFKQCF